MIASHIKPWAKCDSLHERLDGENGLALSPNIDALFDKGFITFSDDGELFVLDDLPPQVVNARGIDEAVEQRLIAVSEQRAEYLACHREHRFRD